MTKPKRARACEWKKLREHRRVIYGKTVRVAEYRRGDHKIEIPVNKIDHIIRITNSPQRWLNKHPVVPLGKQDDNGFPLYKVIRLNEQIAKSTKDIRKLKRKD